MPSLMALFPLALWYLSDDREREKGARDQREHERTGHPDAASNEVGKDQQNQQSNQGTENRPPGHSSATRHRFKLSGFRWGRLDQRPRSRAKKDGAGGSFAWPGQRWLLGTFRITWSTCCPHPVHVVFPHFLHLTALHMAGLSIG